MDFTALSAVIATVAGVIGVIKNAFGVLDMLVAAGRWIHRKGHSETRGVPTRTVIAMAEPRINALWWGHAKIADAPAMQAVGDFDVTNIWSNEVRLLTGLLRYRRGFTRHFVRCHPGVRDTFSPYSGPYPIPPGRTSRVRLGFVFPDRNRPEKPCDFVGDVGLVDQFGNHHWLRGLRFKHPEKMF